MEYLVMGPFRIRSSTEPPTSVMARRMDVNLCRGILSGWDTVMLVHSFAYSSPTPHPRTLQTGPGEPS